MQTVKLDKAMDIWPEMSGMIYVPRTEEEYERLVLFLDTLIDEVGENESHPLASLMDVVGVLVEQYEDRHVPELSK
jgi:HTH-type transcriptional regulator/antitoxin HigA